MNKKAQSGPIGAIFLFLLFLVMWFIWLGEWINTIGAYVVVQNGLNGIEAFAFNNLNFIILISMVLGMLGYMYWSSST